MKKILSLLTLFCMVFVSNVHAQTPSNLSQSDSVTPPIETITIGSLFGQDHRYSVTYRENGDAMVFMVGTFTNSSSTPISEVTLTSSNGLLEQPVAFQIIREKRCINSEPQQYDSVRNRYIPETPRCLEYQEPNYFDYWWDKTQYYQAKASVTDSSVKLILPKPVKPTSGGSYVLGYVLKNSAKTQWSGATNYTFKTLQISEAIQNLSVGISTDIPKRMRGVHVSMDYYSGVDMTPIGGAVAMAREVFYSPQLDNTISQIGQGTIVKTSKFLSPNDSFEVKGGFAQSYASLYGNELVIIFGVLLTIILVLIGIAIWFYKRGKHMQKDPKKNSNMLKTILLSACGSFLAIILSGFYAVFVYFARMAFDYWGFYELTNFAVLLLTAFSAGVFWLLLILPAGVLFFKKGWMAGAWYTGFSLIWMVLLLILGSMVVMLGRSDQMVPSPMPMPYMNKMDVSAPMMEEGVKQIPISGIEEVPLPPIDEPTPPNASGSMMIQKIAE